mmetsp:Transcript_34838/g.58975  ORF Transcript_34838/g.58975 Transcript_34838/m.58975 type:complete len:403 (-) Transcript_34838:198-1406(-)
MSGGSDDDAALETGNDQPAPVSTPALNSTPDGAVGAQEPSILTNQGSDDAPNVQRLSISTNKDSRTDQSVPLQQLILDVTRNPKFSAEEKRAKVQQLYKKSIDNLIKPEKLETEEGEQPSFHDEKNKILGCKHYKRSCKVQCSECQKFYTCRHCHNAAESHQFNRSAYPTEFPFPLLILAHLRREKTTSMLCMKCMTKQPVGPNCKNPECGARMARYYCGHCRFFDDEKDRDIYHCIHCGICRRGKQEDFFHCKQCGTCVNKDIQAEHKCFSGSMDSNCPACGEYMFTSTKPVMFMPCGHCIHTKCYRKYIRHNYTCPICRKSLLNMTAMFDRIQSVLNEHTMPPEFRDIVAKILCNDCEQYSTAPFHFMYHKCGNCGSFNTQVLSKSKRETESQQADADDE